MFPRSLAAVVLAGLCSTPAFAQGPVQRWPSRGQQGGGPAAAAPAPAPPAPAQRTAQAAPPQRVPPEARPSAPPAPPPRSAEPRYPNQGPVQQAVPPVYAQRRGPGRDSGRVAQPRPPVAPPPGTRVRPGGRVYVAPYRPPAYYYRPRYYAPRYYAPRYVYPYVPYAAPGFGYYYDPFRYGRPSIQVYGGVLGHGRGYAEGEIRLRVNPDYAQVYVDGYFAGTVEDFNGVFQGLRLEADDYHIQIVAPGFEPLDFDVRIIPGQKINYRADMIPEP